MSELLEKLRAFVDVETAAGQPARDPVNPAMIRHWCEAVGDRNPVYTDPELAAHSVHGGLVAPPTMLQAWTMPGLSPRSSAPAPTWRRVFQLLDEAGFTSVVATNSRQEYRRYLRPGDLVSSAARIASVSEEKRTALGPGHFVTQEVDYRDQHGELVARMEFRMLKFRPQAAERSEAKPGEARQAALRPRPATNQDSAYFWRGLGEGRLLLHACAACGALQHPPEPICPACHGLEWREVEASGRGSVYSYVVTHHPVIPPFEAGHLVALVELEEGPRLVAELAGVDREGVQIGMAVQAVFEPAADGDELVVPRFRPAGASP